MIGLCKFCGCSFEITSGRKKFCGRSCAGKALKSNGINNGQLKFCSGCKRILPITYFCRNKARQDGRAVRCIDCHSALNFSYMDKLKKSCFDKFGNKCAHCGFSDSRAFQIDHVNGGGGLDRKGLTPRKFYLKVLADDSDMYQLLCANCNVIKRIERKEFGERYSIKREAQKQFEEIIVRHQKMYLEQLSSGGAECSPLSSC